LTQCEFVTVDDLKACNGTTSDSVTYGAAGLMLNGVRDSQFSNIICSFNNGTGIYNGDSGTYNCYRNSFTNIQTNYNGMWGMFLYRCNNNTLVNIEANSNSQYATSSYGGIYLSTTTNLIMANVEAQNIQATATQQCGINETASSDYNIFNSVNTRYNLVAGVRIIGTHTTVSAYWNLTSYRASNCLNYGSAASAYNGTAIAHGLSTTPTSITLSLQAATAYNATMILCVPTILSINATHFLIELVMWETVGWTQVPVTAVEAQTVHWYASYVP